MCRPEKVQPNDYPKWKRLISDIPRKDDEPQKEYVRRISSYASLQGLPEISDKIYVPLRDSKDYDEYLLFKNGSKKESNDDPYSAEDPTALDPHDREFRLFVLNALTFIVSLDTYDDTTREKHRTNLLRSLNQIFLKEANR